MSKIEELDYKKDYQEFWKEIVERNDGTLDIEHVKRELSDFKYFIDNIPIEQTIKNHKDIFDFCIRLKLKKTTDGIFTYVDDGIISEHKLPRTTRYYISNKGGTILKKHHSTNRSEGVNVGYRTTLFNNYVEKENYDINYTYYIKECYKIVDIIENKQLELF